MTFKDREKSESESKREAQKSFRKMLETTGNLSEDEIKECIILEFDLEEPTVRQQIQRYYLRTKAENPNKAMVMLTDIGPTPDDEQLTTRGIKTLCSTLEKYISGFTICHKGEVYSPSKGNPFIAWRRT